jgi:hypothetical protein
MKFAHRFAYYLLGLIMGSFVVAAIFSGKDTRCNYFPNARVLNDLRNKPFHYSNQASQVLTEKWIDTVDIKNCLKYGDVKATLPLEAENYMLLKVKRLKTKKSFLT